MFRHRETDQKPDEELIDTFKKSFPDVISGVSASGVPSNLATVNPSALKQTLNNRAISDDELKINDPTPCTLQDIRYTSSLLDPSSFSFMSLTNQATEYYAPVTSGMSTAYPQAESLHTSALGVGLVPPLAIPNTLSGTLPSDPVPDITMSEFQNPFISQPFPSLNAFAQQSSYAPPSEFIQRESTYNPLDNSLENRTDPADIPLNSSLGVVTPKASLADHMDVGSAIYGDKFRFRAILRAPTAMVRSANEIPVTYLNKGQAYSISVVDTNPPGLNASNLKYRTFIRVSFEDEEQRSKPAACWQLWRDGRGSNEAHQRGGKLLAVEYVDPAPVGDGKHELPQIELEAASFDGFCVNWSPNPNTRSPDCAISVRFNFLSTDFSHSKGVKGIPVRLCAKTEIVSPGNDTHTLTTTEVCYCKVKLFRDHGAERKLSNDIAHVKKTIDKLKQRIAQQDVCGGNFGKRKRSQSSVTAGSGESRPAKIPKHKRTRSTDSPNDGAGKPPPEEDLHLKLAMMQDMFSSTRPVSVLNLAGEDRDDPDLFPVSLPGSSGNIKLEPLSNQITQESFRSSMDTTSGASYILSPSDSSVSSSEHSIVNHHIRKEEVTDWTGSGAQHSLLTQPLKIHRVPRKGGPLSTGYIEAADIDPNYRPPAECPPKPIACFYVRFPNGQPGDSYYRAVYLSERTVRDFMTKISEKRKIDPDRIGRILRVHSNGLKIAVDDDVVKQLPDEQDMVIEFAEAPNSSCATPDVNTPPSAVEVTLTY